MRLLVLGGTRFIGERIVHEATHGGHEVFLVHRGVTESAAESGTHLHADATHIHADRTAFSEISRQVGALRPNVVVDTNAMTRADADAVLPHLPDVPLILLSSMDVYRAYELLLTGETGKGQGPGQAVPLTETSEVRRGRYPLRGHVDGRDDYDKLDVEPGYLARGGTVLRLGAIYGERDPQRREEFILRRVRAGRPRIPVGAASWLWTRGYVGDVASAVLAVAASPGATSGEIFNVGDLATDTIRDHAERILAAAGSSAELVTVPDKAVPADLEITKPAAQHFLADCGKIARTVDWKRADQEEATTRSVRWHWANPPDAADADFSADDKALAEAAA